MPGQVRVGTSGWSYDHWQGFVYPKGASSLVRLDHYARRFDTVEVNNTFYRWPAEGVFDAWRERVPPGFLLAIKASRGLSQFRKLNDPGPWLERMEAGLIRLGPKRGPLLVQLPPHFPIHLERLDAFLAAVPPQRVAVEFRHPSWHVEETFAVLERRGAAYCVMSGPGLPCVPRATADFVYLRFHGPDTAPTYAGNYTDDDLKRWADLVRGWREQRRDVFAYFNNDGFGHAVRNGETLRALVGA